jgi:ABC-type transport system involved in multi-copper enzyme maturation permease subunit
MIWLTWRQFRAQAITALAILAAAAICFLISGLQMHHTYATDLASCAALDNCDGVLNEFQQTYDTAFQLTQLLVIAAPALIGIFWGAPLIGRELESGTDQLVWNQTVTRTRWLAVKLSSLGLASVATAGVLSYLLTWWAGPLDHINGDRFAAMTFSSRDVVPLAYAAFAFALGTTAGLLMRRTLPAMALTLAVFIAIQILVPTLIRPHLLASTTSTFTINETTTSQSHGIWGRDMNFHFDLPIPQGAWITSAPPVEDSSGHAVRISDYPDCFPGPSATNPAFDVRKIGACLAKYDLHETVTYQPASHYWPLQWIESGIFVVAGGLLSAMCFWWVRRRRT